MQQHDIQTKDQAARYLSGYETDKSVKRYVDDAYAKWSERLGVKSDKNPYGVDKFDATYFEMDTADLASKSLRKEYNELFPIVKGDAGDLYKRHAGETEARNVQTRMGYTPEQRRSTPPWKTEDVPRNKQIIRLLGGK